MKSTRFGSGRPTLQEVLDSIADLARPSTAEEIADNVARQAAACERAEARARAMADAAVGKTMRVQVTRATRHSSGLTVAGVIVRCEYVGMRNRGGSMVAQWRVWIGNREPLVVEALPR